MRADVYRDREVEGGLFINPLSSDPTMTDIHHPTLNLPDPNLPPQSEQPEFPRIAQAPTPTSTSAQTTLGAALSFAKLSHNFKDGPSGDGCCSEGLLISFLMPKYVYYETIAMYW